MAADNVHQGNATPSADALPDISCPSCGRDIAAAPVCPYCCAATASARRVTERCLIGWAALVALLGIGLLVWSAFVETPVTPIARLEHKGAFLHFRVQGKVTRTHYFKARYRDADVFSFFVSDDSSDETTGQTGTIKVKVEGPVYQRLQEEKRVPREGDSVDVEGTLYAGEGFRILSLNTPDMLRNTDKGGK
ncbi:MAG: hypothetical protein FJ109_03685 [Deltaproteobacteria bacterium]|nr:hypothetical protein [Deltaproteobacteria bacterium]